MNGWYKIMEQYRKNLLEHTSHSASFWVSPTGKIIDVVETHVDEIFHNPEGFGMDMKHIKDTYKKFKEPLHSEGKAREELMHELFVKGWIRIRRYVVPRQRWIINLNSLTSKKQDLLFDWAVKMVKEGVHKLEEVYIETYRKAYHKTIGDLIKYNFDESTKKIKKYIYKTEFVGEANKNDRIIRVKA
jgi:hypothetical protein